MNSLLVFVRANRLLSAIVGSILGLILYVAIITYALPEMVDVEVQNEPKRVDCYINGALYMLFPEECEARGRYEIDSKANTSTPYPTAKVTTGKIQQPAIDNDPVIECHGVKGSNCGSQFILLKRSICSAGTYVCCNTGSGWSLQEKTICKTLQADRSVKYINITLPHNGKQYRCKEGLEDDIYNQSLEIKKLKDSYDKKIIILNDYEDKNCHGEYDDLNQRCQEYVDSSKANAKMIFLDGADQNESILNTNISKVCQ